MRITLSCWCGAQVIALEHVRTVVPFAGETENHAEFKAWPMQSRPPPAELPPRPVVPFTGALTMRKNLSERVFGPDKGACFYEPPCSLGLTVQIALE